jgi:hypothetical protein
MEEIFYANDEIDVIKMGSDNDADDDFDEGGPSTGLTMGSSTFQHRISGMIAGSDQYGYSGYDVPEDNLPDDVTYPIIEGDDIDVTTCDKENEMGCCPRPATSSLQSSTNMGCMEQRKEIHQQARRTVREKTGDEMTGKTRGKLEDRFTSTTVPTTTTRQEKDLLPKGELAGAVESIDSIFLADADLLLRKGLFEGTKKGYWGNSETIFPGRPGDAIVACGDGGFGRSNLKSMRGWCHGQILLQATLPSSQQGWVNLLPSEIPSGPPISDSIRSWKEYAHARTMAPTSLAPLLLTNVMTVYHMLFNILNLPDRVPANAEMGRHSGYLVYVLGAERELNHLPIFEELVYLVRGIDLELRFVSPAVKHLMDKARKHFPYSHLITSGDYVIDKEGGLDGSRLRISFEPDDALFHETSVAAASSFALRADAVVALNAGFGYGDTDWEKSILDLLWSRTPFCFSDGTKHDLRLVKDILIPQMMELHFKQRLESGGVATPRCPDVEISQNPFHGAIVQARSDCRISAVSNGHIISYQGERW